jgi:hypothetical protein
VGGGSWRLRARRRGVRPPWPTSSRSSPSANGQPWTWIPPLPPADCATSLPVGLNGRHDQRPLSTVRYDIRWRPGNQRAAYPVIRPAPPRGTGHPP